VGWKSKHQKCEDLTPEAGSGSISGKLPPVVAGDRTLWAAVVGGADAQFKGVNTLHGSSSAP